MLKRHIFSKHQVEKHVPCPYCDQLFLYVETEDECQILFKHMKNYYTGIKGELKSEDGCNAIEYLLLLLQTNVDYVSSHVFKNITYIAFRGNRIIIQYCQIRFSSNSK